MPKTLLLADDSIVIQKLVGLSFANEDVQIVATDNGDDAIARTREVVPDVVLADVVMPGKNGYEVCEAIKQDARLAHIPVLLLTGTFEVFDEGRAARAGADGQITKPFEARALVERVNEYMNRPAATSRTDAPNVDAALAATEDDFFDPNVTTLSPLDASSASDPERRPGPGHGNRAAGLGDRPSESTPAYSGDTSSSLLFGAPGEGASEDDLEPEIGGLALGQTVSNLEAAGVEAAGAPAERALENAPALDPASTSVATSATDDFRAFEDDLGLDEPLEFSDSLSVPPEDLDDELGSRDDDATWLAGLEQPRDADPFSTSDGAERSHDTQGDGQGLDRTGTPTAALPKPARDDSAEPRTGLGLGPASLASDDLEFGFDVSEQISADRLGDSLEDHVLGTPTADRKDEAMAASAPPARGSDPMIPPQRSAASWDTEDILVGYDVSTSDLAGDPEAPAAAGSGVEVSEPIPASAAFVPATSLPPQRIHSEDEPESLDLEADTRPGLTAAEHADQTLVAEGAGLDSEKQGKPIDLDDDREPTRVPTDLEDEPIHPIPDSAEPEDRRIADLSPLMEQRIQETLEKVAWEAFADLSESIVKQVLGRVEQIAWEVIPQMAETLVREEIRRMKGEDD